MPDDASDFHKGKPAL